MRARRRGQRLTVGPGSGRERRRFRATAERRARRPTAAGSARGSNGSVMFVHRIAVVLLGGCAASACYRGYKSAKELDSEDRGPKACAASCKDLGMQMSAFVLVERQTSGCVCSPLDKPA